MRCDNFEQRMNDVLDQRGSPGDDRELRAHADQCAPCRDLLVGQQLLLTGLDLADPPAMSSGFTGRVLARFAEEPSDGLSGAVEIAPAGVVGGMNRVVWWTGGIVAAALVAGFFGWQPLMGLLAPSGPDRPPQPLANKATPEVAPEKKVAPIPVPEASPMVVVKQPEVSPKLAMNPDAQFGRLLEAVQTLPTQEGSEFASQVVDGLRPIAEPMGSVLNVVRRGFLGETPSPEVPPRKPQANSLSPAGSSAVS